MNRQTKPVNRAAQVIIAAGEISPADLLLPANADFNSKADAIGKLVLNGKKSFLAAGRILAELVDADPNAYEKVLKRNPDLDARFLILLEQVGRGQKHEAVLMLGDPVVAARVESLPMPQQERVFEKPLPVAVKSEGGFRKEFKTLKEMSRTEVMRAIGPDRVLSFDEQVEQEKRKIAQQQVLQKVRWIINGDEVQFIGSPKLRASDLEALLTQLKNNSTKGLQAAIKRNQASK